MKSTAANTKTRKNSRDKDKKKSQIVEGGSNQNSSSDKGSPTKESNARLYAGLDADTIQIYAEQATSEHISEEICDAIAEDINYKLRYIINHALIKARLSGKSFVSSTELEETFENLHIEKVYGATSQPNWLSLEDQNLYFLHDREVNLVQIAEKPQTFEQPGDPIITKTSVPNTEISESLRTYFTSMCEFIVSSKAELRQYALVNIAENPRIFPIVKWFYNFAFILLSSDIEDSIHPFTYALDLVLMLECSRNCRIHAPEKQLRLITRAIVYRLIKLETDERLLKPLCSTMEVLCWRYPLKEFVMKQVMDHIQNHKDYSLPIVMIICHIGIDAIREVFLPNITFFFKIDDPEVNYRMLEIYNICRKEGLLNKDLYELFSETFGGVLCSFQERPTLPEAPIKEEINFVGIKTQIIKQWKIYPRPSRRRLRYPISVGHVFDMPSSSTPLGEKINEFLEEPPPPLPTRKFNKLIIGKTSLLLSVFNNKRPRNKKTLSSTYCDSLLFYNF